MKIDRQPYLRIVVNYSQRCNMRCTWCHEEGMSLSTDTSLMSPAAIGQVANMMHSTGTKKFKIVGGEPTLRGDLVQIIQTLRAIGSDIDVSMVTNGSRLQRHVREFQDAGLNRVNVSLY